MSPSPPDRSWPAPCSGPSHPTSRSHTWSVSAGLFGINENRARVALSRMVASGEAVTDGEGHYRVAGHLAERPGAPGGQPGRGQPALGGRVAPGGRHHLGQHARGARPASSGPQPGPAGRAARGHVAAARQPRTRPARRRRRRRDPIRRPARGPGALAGQLWDLEAWSARAGELARRLADLPTEDPGDLAPGFVLSAAVLRHLGADPLLPPALLADSWPGGELRRAYDEWDAGYRRVLRDWSRALHEPARDPTAVP